MKVYVYNENCVMKGTRVLNKHLSQSSDPDNDCHWTMYEGTLGELLQLADILDKHNKPWNPCTHRTAKTLRDAVSSEIANLAAKVAYLRSIPENTVDSDFAAWKVTIDCVEAVLADGTIRPATQEDIDAFSEEWTQHGKGHWECHG